MTPSASTSRNVLNQIRCGQRDRPLVVLVHPIGLELSYWGEQIAALESRFDVLAYDLPGHGRSGPFEGFDHGFASMAEQVHALITQAGRGAAHVVGHSLGGMVAQTLAIAHPDVVRSMTLIDTACTLSDEGRKIISQRADITRQGGMAAILQPTLDRWFAPDFAARRPDVLDRVSKTLLACDPEVHAVIWGHIAQLHTRPKLESVRCPTLVMVGELDPTTPVAASRLIAQGIRGAELSIVPGTSHMPTLESPEAVNARLTAFLNALG